MGIEGTAAANEGPAATGGRGAPADTAAFGAAEVGCLMDVCCWVGVSERLRFRGGCCCARRCCSACQLEDMIGGLTSVLSLMASVTSGLTEGLVAATRTFFA